MSVSKCCSFASSLLFRLPADNFYSLKEVGTESAYDWRLSVLTTRSHSLLISLLPTGLVHYALSLVRSCCRARGIEIFRNSVVPHYLMPRSPPFATGIEPILTFFVTHANKYHFLLWLLVFNLKKYKTVVRNLEARTRPNCIPSVPSDLLQKAFSKGDLNFCFITM